MTRKHGLAAPAHGTLTPRPAIAGARQVLCCAKGLCTRPSLIPNRIATNTALLAGTLPLGINEVYFEPPRVTYFGIGYSARNASMGSSAAARRAGYIPKTVPNDAEKRKPTPAAGHEITVSQ